jgi:hypothetical protein
MLLLKAREDDDVLSQTENHLDFELLRKVKLLDPHLHTQASNSTTLCDNPDCSTNNIDDGSGRFRARARRE